MSDFLPCVEINPAHATHSIVWLHGLGADGHDFEPIVNELNLNHPIRFIFPHAPEMSVTVNNGLSMPAWYDITTAKIDAAQDEAGIKKSQQAILALLEREIERGIPSNNIILAGFSQGGAIALHTGLRYEKPLAGIMGLSTYLPLVNSVANEVSDANKQTPIFLAHGSYDPIIPYPLAVETQATLNKLNYATELKKYEMEHSVCVEEVDDISHWINRVFS
ncbi:MAG: alpha/beta hydrolase [Gammaproteobacteria bacterium]|nr:alpha/beta hydrolase [Gammaproteobacteria bacterium]MCW8987814.1 alpha/beta hydrolase [Gammaproteobacteria bacterium]